MDKNTVGDLLFHQFSTIFNPTSLLSCAGYCSGWNWVLANCVSSGTFHKLSVSYNCCNCGLKLSQVLGLLSQKDLLDQSLIIKGKKRPYVVKTGVMYINYWHQGSLHNSLEFFPSCVHSPCLSQLHKKCITTLEYPPKHGSSKLLNIHDATQRFKETRIKNRGQQGYDIEAEKCWR
jgi:hypothetical protein